MAKTKIKRNKKGIHLHIPRYWGFALLFLLASLLITVSYLGWRYYMINYFDSSASKRELRDLSPPPVPPEIKNKLAQLMEAKIREGTAEATMSAKIPILMYHYIEYVKDRGDKTRMSLDLIPYAFEEEIKTLKSAGYTFLTMRDIADILDKKGKVPEKPIALTFDDGYRDFYTDAYPILKKYQVKATEFVISGFIDRPNHLLASQVQELAQDPLIEIAAHTVHHYWLKNLKLQTVSAEVFQSRIMLQDLIKKPVVSFAYPYGAFDSQSAEVVRDAGFRTSVSTLPGDTQGNLNRFYLFRLRPGGRTGQALLNWLNSL